MTQNDDQSSATKADIAKIIKRLEKIPTKDEVEKMIENKLNVQYKNMMRHTGVLLEDFHHDLAGAIGDLQSMMKDYKSTHEKRIVVLERRAGIF